MLPIHEFLLWPNCNNNCKFCWQKKEKQLNKVNRLNSIQQAKTIVSTLKDSHILFVGGEIFSESDLDVQNALFDLFDFTFQKMKKNDIDLCYINTNILYNINNLLLPVLHKIQELDLLSKIHFTTSADNYGRFENTKNLFYDNLSQIVNAFPTMYTIANIILTENFCKDILTDKFNIKEYKDTYKVDVNTIPYIKYGTIIGAPTRQMVFDSLIHLDKQDPGYLLKYTNNFTLNQNIILHKYENGEYHLICSDKSVCGHSENFKRCYSDSDECFICDCMNLKKIVCEA